ncbi:hypothetical protein [Sphingomonas montanisoli]|uniref:Uncharacterized protein n=1 Tax=Sphingomonas montanisoli TaxID=2606412 RepID=A0A5D9C3P0_9SPHN|nr:hypothetical protein [Sphingomonas montanisoli]TZG25590.1 hypothetical protein FYJ91_11220 [Sphingomonas montanisoli]
MRAQAERDREQAERESAEAENQKRVAALWREQEPAMMAALDAVNAAFQGLSTAIHQYSSKPASYPHIAYKEFGLTKARIAGTLQTLNINVGHHGLVDVAMGTSHQRPIKSQKFQLEDADFEKWKNVFLDFIEVNTPASPS